MFEFASAIIGCYIPGKECSLGSGNCALYIKCGIEMYPMTGVIIYVVSALGLMGKARIKISYYYYYYYYY